MSIYDFDKKKVNDSYTAGSVNALSALAAKYAKQVNQRLYRLEKAGKGLTDTAYKYAQHYTGKNKPRYNQNVDKYKKMDVFELKSVLNQLEKQITSKTSTLRGIQQTTNKRIKQSVEALAEFDVDLKNYELYDYFLKHGGGDLMNDYDSVDIVDEWRTFTDRAKDKEAATRKFLRNFGSFKIISGEKMSIRNRKTKGLAYNQLINRLK